MSETIEKEEVKEEIENEEVNTDDVDLASVDVEDDKEEKEEVKEETKAEDEVVVTIGDEEPPEHEKMPDWVREMRDSNRKLNKRNKELERAAEESQPASVVVGKKPEMSDPDIDYNADKFEAAYSGWSDRKAQADNAAESVESEQKKQATAWQGTLDHYGESRQALNVPDYEDSEEITKDVLSEVQQNILMHGAANPALVVYALGKNPAKAKELAKITDHIKFAFAVSKLEAQLKMTKRKPSTPPEKIVSGTAQISANSDATLEKLEAEYERSLGKPGGGDRTKIQEHKRKLKANG